MNFLEVTVCRVILRTYFYMEETGRENSLERFHYLRELTKRLTEEVLEAWRSDAGAQAMRYQRLVLRISHPCTEPSFKEEMLPDQVAGTALDLCLAAMYVPEFAAYLSYYTGNAVTMQLAFEMEGIPYVDYADMADRITKLRKVCWIDQKKHPIHYAAIEGDNYLLAYLTGEGDLGRVFSEQAEWFLHDAELHPMFIRQDLAGMGAKKAACGSIVQISGRGGRRFLAKHIARLLEKDLLFLNGRKYGGLPEENREQSWSRFVHGAFLKEAMVCIYGISTSVLSELEMDEADAMEMLIRPFWEADIPVLLCTETDVSFASFDELSVWNMALTEPSREEREAIFSGFSRLYGIPLDCGRASVRYRLSPSETARAAKEWRRTSGNGEEEFCKICDDILYKGQEHIFGRILYPSIGLEDLKAPPQIKETLRQICSGATDGYRIFEEWNLKRQYPYGRAMTVLLSGPPGTGKTMTAHVIAKELGIPLYQVDLSHVMDKYIGETEKHLEQIFTFAEKANPVLFFDEADGLFGKRGQAAEGKDRYANMEVSYILQRIEQFDGIVVLATNFYNNIDKAFLRRMKYVLKYQNPDAEIRKSIWESCLPPELPREELDVDYLARQFDFTGGTIKNVVYTACVMAVHEGTRLRMLHVLRAVCAEYDKIERTVTRDMWGEYGYLMEEH